MNKYDDLDPFIQKILSLKCVMLLRQTRKTLYELSEEYNLDREKFEG